MREKLIHCFQDTLRIAEQYFSQETYNSIMTSRVYAEGFLSQKPKGTGRSYIYVEADTTFSSAGKYRHLGKVAVLNFANPEFPGGGVQNGAMAQEECLCRSSNLYPCISNQSVFRPYYQYHRELRNPFYTDRLIYTNDVKVFKNDDAIPEMLPENEWFNVDVITCAAPYLGRQKYTNIEVLLRLFKGRIKNIFEVARDNNVDVLILGAFGCGAFKNPPLVVAQAFEEVIREENYCACFKQIVFAIKPTGEHCPNLAAFSAQFDKYASDKEEESDLFNPLEASAWFRFQKTPALKTGKFAQQNWNTTQLYSLKNSFIKWQANNRYFGKQFSILGDSISTLDGYNPPGYNVFYTEGNCSRAGVWEMKDTWWDKVISFFGGELLVNNSWSGSRVAKLPDRETLFPSGCSDERTSSLHINSVIPDVIIVYLGTNDWGCGVNPNEEAYAYDLMLKKLRRNYPYTEIWCCTLSETFRSDDEDFLFPHAFAGGHIEVYNEIIKKAAWDNQCRLIDLYSFHTPYDSIDGSHPTSDGMETIAIEIIRSVAGAEADMFLNSENPVLRLTSVDTGETMQFAKNKVTVGRGQASDLRLGNYGLVSRHHAAFLYENQMWFLCDDGSTNGTWVNGERLYPGNKYKLSANDKISFATAAKFIFEE